MRSLSLACAVALAVTYLTPCHAQDSSAHSEHVVHILAGDHSFEAPEEIPSGWTTFRMQNGGNETHFAILSRLPEGKTLDDYLTDVGMQFSNVVHAVRSGTIDNAEAQEQLNGLLPAWVGSLQRLGGPGLLSSGRTAETTLRIEPGNYFIECYMKTEDGAFHAMEGMARPLTVTEGDSGAPEPEADVLVTLSNDGIDVEGELTPGRHIVAVHFAEHPDGGYPPHDVHLARLDAEADGAELIPWMDWLGAEGLVNPAPTEFVGGTHELPAGSTAYIAMNLEPGRYAWISQMTGAMGLVKEFTIQQ